MPSTVEEHSWREIAMMMEMSCIYMSNIVASNHYGQWIPEIRMEKNQLDMAIERSFLTLGRESLRS